MPSSISSSEHGWFVRHTPSKPWAALAAVALAVTVALTGLWELRVRAMGYGPTYEDTLNLWAKRRTLASGAGPEQLVFVGASRTLFDIDLQTFADATGGPLPIQLATVGSNPLAIVEDLAADASYRGTTIVGIVPSLIAAGAGPPVVRSKKFVDHFHKFSPADRLELVLAMAVQRQLALANEDLTLSALLERGLDLPNRPDAYAPKIPGYMYSLEDTRQARMIPKVEQDPATQHEIQQLWIPLFTPPPKPAVFSDEQWADMMRKGWDSNLERLVRAVAAITSRGGRVIFVRHPSSDHLRELERQYTPRALFWERVLAETGAPGVHFEDHPSLAGFKCPEWSHLSGADALEYSRRLVAVMQERGLL